MEEERDLFKNLYFMLFYASTDAVELLESGHIQEARERLIQAELVAEALYINSDISDD